MAHCFECHTDAAHRLVSYAPKSLSASEFVVMCSLLIIWIMTIVSGPLGSEWTERDFNDSKDSLRL